MKLHKLPFAREEYLGRIERVRRAMAERRLDLLLISAPENILWLTGYQAKGIFSFQMLLVPADGPVRLVTRTMETGNVLCMPKDGVVAEFVTYGDTEVPTEALVRLVKAKYGAARRLGTENLSMFLGVTRYEAIRTGLDSASFEDATHLVDKLRLVKSPAEIAIHRRSAEISDAAVKDSIAAVKVGTTDREIAAVTMASLIRHGSEYCSTWPNVMAGWRGGLAHAGWAGERIEAGEPCCIEFAASVERYHSPLYRTVIPGKPSAEVKKVADCARRAHDAGQAVMRPGATIGEVDAAVRAVVEKDGCAKYAHSRFGYTIGVAFPPTWAQSMPVNIVPGSKFVFEPNMLFHLLVYLLEPAVFGVGVSHTILFTEKGIEPLTKTDKGPYYV
jgi:Xaa-Pro dipeptidase